MRASLLAGAALVRALVTAAMVLLLAGTSPARGSLLTYLGAEFDGVAGVSGLQIAISAATSPDGAHLYVASADALAVFELDPITGALTFVEAEFDGVAGVDGLGGILGTQAVAVSPDGAHVYAASAVDDAVAVFSRDPATGALTFVEVQRDGVNGVDGLNGSWTVTVSPDGAHAYAAGFADRGVAVFNRNPSTGALTFVEAQFNGTGGVVGLEDP